ncbi:MAG TPA: hypothetical protein VGI97_14740 [Gemmatimonadaceae bacterium]|jgi:hypothetical protein
MPRATLNQIAICNMALTHLAVGKRIASLTEKSAEARACSNFYDQTKDEVLRDFAWPFATKTVTLALVEQQPTFEWGYAYRVPIDCLAARRILNGNISVAPFPNSFSAAGPYATPAARIMTAQTRIPYRLMADDSGELIYCDLAPVAPIPASSQALAQPGLPQLEYTFELDNPPFYPSDFSQALAFLLGAYIAGLVTGGDKFKRGDYCLKMYSWAIARAQANAGNEEQPDQLPDSEAIRDRR